MKNLAMLSAICLLGAAVTAQTTRTPRTRKEAILELQAQYAQDNEDLFMGQLPKDTVVSWADLSFKNDMGLTIPYPNHHYMIKIDKRSNPVYRQARMTLHHEECHIKTWDKEAGAHGSAFQQCMVDLAVRGAFVDLW